MAKDLHKNFKYRKIKRPNKFLAIICQFFMKRISKKRNVQYFYDENYSKLKKEQVIYLCQHASKDDYIYMFAGVKRRDIHIVCGYQNIFQKGIYFMLKRLGVIAKYLYQPDISATMQILQAVKLGDSIAVFPEGIQSTSGSTHPINPATMALLCKLKLPVILVSSNGSYFTKPRYSRDIRKGKISISYKQIFASEDFSKYNKEQLEEMLLENFKYNEYEKNEQLKIAFHGEKPNIDGLDNIIYKCPHCMAENNFEISDKNMRCKACDFEISMNEYYQINEVNKTLPFKNVDQWFKWQRKIIKEEIESKEFSIRAKVKLGKLNTKKLSFSDSTQYLGEGMLELTNKGLTYSGTKNGEEIKLEFSPELVYSLTMSLAYDLDLYYKSEYYSFKLLENEKLVAKWMLAAEEIHNLHDKAWKDASSKVYEYEK